MKPDTGEPVDGMVVSASTKELGDGHYLLAIVGNYQSKQLSSKDLSCSTTSHVTEASISIVLILSCESVDTKF